MDAKLKKLNEKDLYGALWRVNNFAGNYNYERLMALGMTQVMVPVFRGLGITGDKLKEGLKRHMVFYNTHPYFGALIMGVMVAMEEAKTNDDEGVTEEAINGFKVALMGPFAGIGDSFFWGTVHPIILAVSANLALQGNMLGFVFAFLIAAEAILGTFYPFIWGYKSGTEIVEKIRASKLIQKFTEGAKIVAMFVAGVMVTTLINISTPVVLFGTEAEGSGVNLQGVFDSILPKLLPLGLLFLVYWLLKKKLNPLWVMVILMVLTVALKALGWLG